MVQRGSPTGAVPLPADRRLPPGGVATRGRRQRGLGLSWAALSATLVGCCGCHCGQRPGERAADRWRQQAAASLGCDPSRVWRIKDVPAGGLLSGRAALFLVTERQQEDCPGEERLCYECPGASFVIRDMRQLAGRVAVTSPELALRYVRLFSSPATVKCLREPWWMEVVARSTVDVEFLLDRYVLLLRPPFWKAAWPSGWGGILSDSDWAEAHLPPPSVDARGDHYVVTRSLAWLTRQSPTTHLVWTVRDSVSRQGSIQREVVGPPLAMAAQLEALQ